MISKLSILINLSLLFSCYCDYGYVTWKYGRPVVSFAKTDDGIPDTHVARATYSNKISSTGWAFLELYTSKEYSDEKQAYAAGYLEGYLTRDLIWMHYRNVMEGYCFNKTDICNLIDNYIDQNEEYILSMITDNPSDPYWYQIKLYYIQLEGLAVGYTEATDDRFHWLTTRDILWLNLLGDLEDLEFALTMPEEIPTGILFGEHCSGLVKLLPDLSDLLTAHVTWNSYQSMLRFQKVYVFNFNLSANISERIPGYKMSFSSYPGLIQSADDFYIVSSGLVAAETTIGNTNRSLYRRLRPRGQVLEFVRAMVANRLARSGREWVKLFRHHNSGTYNNQWYIVDYNKFRARSAAGPGAVKAGLLWVLEQLPGYTQSADLTEELKKSSYFPSYNIPYFPRVFNLSGGNQQVAAHGDWFGYHTHPRAKIFKDKQGDVDGLWAALRLMRYNDFRRDPRARCACRPPYSAENAVSARNDLNPPNGTYPFAALGHRSHGGTDAKVTNAELMRSYRFLSVSGPTYNLPGGIPPFEWSKFDLGSHIKHYGHPNLWVFPPVLKKWKWK